MVLLLVISQNDALQFLSLSFIYEIRSYLFNLWW